MPKGFFSQSDFQGTKPTSKLPLCGLCGLYKNCKSPKMPVTGKGKKNILVVAEAPGQEEDKYNEQLIGKAGHYLRRILRKLDVNLDRDCWKTNAIICRPPHNETPENKIIEACRPNLLKTIDEIKPRVIILLGGIATKSLIGSMWTDSTGFPISRWIGWSIPSHKYNCWIIPTWHPSYLLRQSRNNVLALHFKKHLKLALGKSLKRPWNTVPDYEKQVEIISRPSQAAKLIIELMNKKGAIAFDYETNCLKPDGEGPEIVSCSICWKGKKTFAYPFQGNAIEATSKLLKSPVPKIGFNLQFEERWTRAILGHPVRNWFFDSMIATHRLDNRQDICSLKFQSFVNLGAAKFKDVTEPYLKPSKDKFNRIHELDWKDLLLRNGMDSLLTYKLAMKQMKLLRIQK